MTGRRHISSVFADMASFVTALRGLRAAGMRDLSVHSPAGLLELEPLLPRRGSPVRFFALLAGLAGCLLAFWMCSGSALLYGLIVGGKWPASILPYCVIAFELTVLLGGLTALAAVLAFARLRPAPAQPPYDPRFGEDQFGITVYCAESELPSVARLLRQAGAREVHEQRGSSDN